MTAATAAGTRQIIKSATVALTGKKARGHDREVRRDSYDLDDPRARVFAPIADGSVAGGLGWCDDLMKVAREYDAQGRCDPKAPPGSRGPLNPHALVVLEALLSKVDFATGKLDPAIAWLETVTGFARKTVVAALARLRRHGFFDWVRRSRKVEGEDGPRRKQETNAYFFDLGRLPRRVLQRFRDLRQRRRRHAENSAPTSLADKIDAIKDPELAQVLTRLRRGIEGPSPSLL